MRILYEKILETFDNNKECFVDKELIAPKFIDLYDSQPDTPEEFEFMCPAIFIDYNIVWERSGSQRIGTLLLEVHCLSSDTPETDNHSQRLPEGLQKIDFYETVADLLDGLATEETSGLVLTAERPVTTDYFNYHILTFECTISRSYKGKRFADGTVEGVKMADSNIKQYLVD
ncbi:MAG: hypothetical protein LBN95_06055 [Prevotellaceae bacterium]|jgi:hypothetical protein|nr:hypothetical protein [Prevotellaceae bacterium]